MPAISNFSQTAAHVRRQEKIDRKTRRDRLRAKIAAQKNAGEQVDCKDVAEASGRIDPEPTARGKESRSMKTASIEIPSEVAKVEQAVRALPNWLQAPLFRTYLYGQPHRVAARELRMYEPDYRSRWRQAVVEVGKTLAMRATGAVDSYRPPVRVESA
jgi:DNA-directed RNA polymerase specialized sigma24 family protein